MRTTLLALVAFMFILPFVSAQNKPCNNYACVIEKVEYLMKLHPSHPSRRDKNYYKTLLDNLDSAEGYPNSKEKQIHALRQRVFVEIQKERENANTQRKLKESHAMEAKLAEAKTDSVTAIFKEEMEKVKNAFLKSDSLLQLISNQKNIIEQNLILLANISPSSHTRLDTKEKIALKEKSKETENALIQLTNLMSELEQVKSSFTYVKSQYPVGGFRLPGLTTQASIHLAPFGIAIYYFELETQNYELISRVFNSELNVIQKRIK